MSEGAPGASLTEAEGEAADRNLVDELAICILRGPLRGGHLRLTAHADSHGTGDYMPSLGSSRADFVYELFLREGVAPEQLRQAPADRTVDGAVTDAARRLVAQRVDVDVD